MKRTKINSIKFDADLDENNKIIKWIAKPSTRNNRKFADVLSDVQNTNDYNSYPSSTPLRNSSKNTRTRQPKLKITDCSQITGCEQPDNRIFDENVIVHTSATEWFFSEETKKPKKEKIIKKRRTGKKVDCKPSGPPQLENVDDHQLFIQIVE